MRRPTKIHSIASNRREFLAQASLLVTGATASSLLPLTSRALAWAAEPKASADVVGETTNGKVRGQVVDGVNVFKGIPYGSSTAGKNRFRPPQKVQPWSDLRDARQWGRIAPQAVASNPSDYGRLINWADQPGGQSEDCLNLNVWTQGLKDGGKRPVLVLFHGGGFTSGSGNHHGFTGQYSAKRDNTVVVTVNHRLGALGYTHLGDLPGGEPFKYSGVAGVLDLVASLEWVRDNIANFGGDPGCVMIFGQSGGGAKTSTLLAMPPAKGLFHKAGVQSGSSLRSTTREAGAQTAENFLSQLGIDKSKLAEVQDVPLEKIMSARGGSGPVMGSDALPRHPFDPDAPEVSAEIPMIIGTTLDDAALSLTNFDLDEAGLLTTMRRTLGDRTETVVAAYRKAFPNAAPFLIQARILTDRGFRSSAVTQAERKAAQKKAPAYFYLFAWPSPGMGGKFGAVHGVDVPLPLHNTTGQSTGDGPDARQLADQMSSAWVSFAKSGNPNNKALPNWPAYNAETRPTMVFDTKTRVENDPFGDLRRLALQS